MSAGSAKLHQRKDLLPPCKDCPDRYPGCHDHCEKESYLEWRRLRELKRQDEQARSSKNIADLLPSDERYHKRK